VPSRRRRRPRVFRTAASSSAESGSRVIADRPVFQRVREPSPPSKKKSSGSGRVARGRVSLSTKPVANARHVRDCGTAPRFLLTLAALSRLSLSLSLVLPPRFSRFSPASSLPPVTPVTPASNELGPASGPFTKEVEWRVSVAPSTEDRAPERTRFFIPPLGGARMVRAPLSFFVRPCCPSFFCPSVFVRPLEPRKRNRTIPLIFSGNPRLRTRKLVATVGRDEIVRFFRT
jgi:hypothetical protein